MKEKSCGAVIYKKENDSIKVLLIHQNSGFWSFPKGHVEKNETEVETALREVKEETNLSIKLDKHFKYSIEYKMEDKNKLKEVVYFIGTPLNNDIKVQESELDDFKWLDSEEALNVITYDNTKEVLKKVLNYLKNIDIDTKRLALRKFRSDDYEDAYNNYLSDLKTSEMLDFSCYIDKNDALKYINLCIEDYKNNPYRWFVTLKDTKEIIGAIDVVKYNKTHKCAEIGYCYGSKYWGNGYATEALVSVINYLFNNTDLEIIELKHINDNPASGRVMQKAGMKYDGTLRSRKINKKTGKRNDIIIYSITRREFLNN